MPGLQVTRVTIGGMDGRTATGVEAFVAASGKRVLLSARKEVCLCAGAIGTNQH